MSWDGSSAGVLDELAAGVWVTDAQGQVLEVNRAASEMLGYRRDELLGMPLTALTHPEDYAQRESPDARTGVLVARRRLRHKDGRYLLAEGRARRTADGRIITVVVDITALAQAEQAREQKEREFRALFELAASGKAVLEPRSGRLLRVNRKLCEITGYSEEELLARSFFDITHPDDREADARAMQAALSKQTRGFRREKRYLRKDGSTAWVLVAGSLIEDGDGAPPRALATIVDISDRVHAEEELRQADRRKDEFLAVLSHELRNPLAAVQNSAEVLARVEPGAPTAARALGTLSRQVAQLRRLVDDLLDLTRVTHGKIQLKREPLDLAALARHTLEDHRPVLAARRLTVQSALEAPAWVDGDAVRLAQVLGNLLSNAAKFTPEGGTVRVEVTGGPEQVTLAVQDSGPGVDPSLLPRLFEPFHQGDSSLARTSGGLGLGLALVRRLARLHGGEVEVTSERGQGARFAVRLPAVAPPASAAPGPAVAAAGARRVLVIEDNEDAAESLKDALELFGHEVALAANGPAGLLQARAFSPDVVLCDIGLPGMDGYAVAKAMREDPGLRGARLIALSGYALPEDVRKALAAGFDEHLAKPPRLEQVEAVIAAAPVRPASR